ncbi:MAG: DUF349 domain-containing protein [Muribaculaceae bacterium]|nr:DUF349 domain-containing protein [Muribaculaceae bacterium]
MNTNEEMTAPLEQALPEIPAANYHAMGKNELVDELQKIVDEGDMTAHRTVAAIKAAFYVVHNKEVYDRMTAFVEAGNSPDAFAAPADPVEAQFKDLLALFRDRRNAYLEADEQKRLENLAAKNAILDQLRVIAEDIDNVGVNFSKFHQLQQDFKVKADLPAGSENDLWKMYQTVSETFYDRLKMNKELRDLDFKKNLEAKKLIIERAQALLEDKDIIATVGKLQTLHGEWREIGPVAKDLREEIWNEFKTLSTAINRRHQEFFEARKAEENVNKEAKEALIAELEAIDIETLKTVGAWDKAGKQVLDIQTRWRAVGPAPRKVSTQLYSRYRELCDKFFAAKSEFYNSLREQYAENLKKKIALCEKVEALLDETDHRKAMDTVTELRAEWKEVGPVSRRHSDEVWKRFSDAAQKVYDSKKRADGERKSAEQANLQIKREILESIKALPLDGDQKEVMAEVRALQARWQETGHVPYSVKDKLNTEYREACDNLYNTYGQRSRNERTARFNSRLENMKGDPRRVNRERDRLVWALEQKEAELHTINNNLGFFNVKSSAGSSLVKDIERRAERIKTDIEQLREKIAAIDAAEKES